jgi:hypothetical protein
LSRWYNRQLYDSFHNETVETRPAVHPYYVRVFLFEAPDGAFDVIGTLGCAIEDGRDANEHPGCRDLYGGCTLERADRERFVPYVREQAGPGPSRAAAYSVTVSSPRSTLAASPDSRQQ